MYCVYFYLKCPKLKFYSPTGSFESKKKKKINRDSKIQNVIIIK